MLAEVISTLRRTGIEVKEKAEVEGASGIKHVFDLLVESGPVAIDLCNGNLATLEKAITYIIKCKDVELAGVKALLMMVGQPPEEVKKLLEGVGLRVVDVPNPDRAAEHLVRLLAQ